MKKLILLVAVALGVYGYMKLSPKEQEQVQESGRNAASMAGKVFGRAYEAIISQAQKVDDKSSTAELERVEKDLKDAKEKAEKSDSKESKDKVAKLESELERIRAALDIQSLKKQLDEKVDDAKKMKENAEKSADDVKSSLAKADSAYKGLKEKLDDAQKRYDDLASKFSK